MYPEYYVGPAYVVRPWDMECSLVLCGPYICDTVGCNMYMEYCVVPTYVTSWDMECTQSIVWDLHM